MMKRTVNRRSFIKTASAAGAVSAIGFPQILKAQEDGKSPNERLQVAFIGVGGIGGSHTGMVKNAGDTCPCYCDVDTNRMGNAASKWPDAKAYTDYREMLEKEEKNIDAVMIGTPDHHHYPATVIAMQLGKAVYTQKPLTHTVWEARELTKGFNKYKVATQMGNQGHANEGNRLMYEWVRSGALGEIKEVHAFTNRPVWPQGQPTPAGSEPVPDSLNWENWVGPAPMRPYHSGYNPFVWRGWWDYGAGALGDMACHTMDAIWWAMEPGHANSVECLERTEMTKDNFPKKSIVKWNFPKNDWRPGFDVYWYDGGLKPDHPVHLEDDRDLPGTGVVFVGTKCSIMSSGDYGGSPRIIPESKMREVGRPPKMLERSPGHYEEWQMAAKGEKPYDFPKSNFNYAGPFSEGVLLGNVALRLNEKLNWDGENLRVTNNDAANALINKEYREGWRFRI